MKWFTIASRTARSAYSGLFFRPSGSFSQPLLVFDFTKFMASRSNMRTLPVNSASLMASPFSVPSHLVRQFGIKKLLKIKQKILSKLSSICYYSQLNHTHGKKGLFHERSACLKMSYYIAKIHRF